MVDPPRRLVFTWVWDDQPDQPQLIELEFSERDGSDDGADDEQRDPHGRAPGGQERGWNVCYDNLDRLLAG